MPGALADLELAETGRAELGDERRQELAAQAVDRGVVGRPFRGGAIRAAGFRLDRFGHSLDLLTGGRLVARPRRDGGADGTTTRIEQVAQAIPESATGRGFDLRRLALSVGPERPVAAVAAVEELVDAERVERGQPVEEDRP